MISTEKSRLLDFPYHAYDFPPSCEAKLASPYASKQKQEVTIVALGFNSVRTKQAPKHPKYMLAAYVESAKKVVTRSVDLLVTKILY
jgi:hypothetical protein